MFSENITEKWCQRKVLFDTSFRTKKSVWHHFRGRKNLYGLFRDYQIYQIICFKKIKIETFFDKMLKSGARRHVIA